MPIKLIASDLDGTLVDHNNFIPNGNLIAIEDINKKNIDFAICTGKTYAISKDVCKDLCKISAIETILYIDALVPFVLNWINPFCAKVFLQFTMDCRDKAVYNSSVRFGAVNHSFHPHLLFTAINACHKAICPVESLFNCK